MKADACGTGIAAAGPALAAAGCETFFVAHLSEARRLRAAVPGATNIRAGATRAAISAPPDCMREDFTAATLLAGVSGQFDGVLVDEGSRGRITFVARSVGFAGTFDP